MIGWGRKVVTFRGPGSTTREEYRELKTGNRAKQSRHHQRRDKGEDHTYSEKRSVFNSFVFSGKEIREGVGEALEQNEEKGGG